MCLELRKTASRGRSGVPTILLRTCWRRRSWRNFLAFCWSMAASRLRSDQRAAGLVPADQTAGPSPAARVALGDALDHIVDQAARQAVQRSVEPLVVGPFDRDGLAIALDLEVRVRGDLKLALGSLNADLAVGDVDFHAAGDGDRLLADTG